MDDLIEEMIWRLLPKGGRIEEVHGEAACRLNKVGGIGAILKR